MGEDSQSRGCEFEFQCRVLHIILVLKIGVDALEDQNKQKEALMAPICKLF